MDPERYRQVKQILQEALGLEPALRAAFLDRACRGDGDLRREVESLLSFDSDQDLAVRAGIDLDAFPPAVSDRFLPGFVIDDRWEIKRFLGAGAMGAVYLATDQRLAVDVAVKVLSGVFLDDSWFLPQLRTEALFSMKLSHDNIVQIRHFEDRWSRPYIVMEYVAGGDLDGRLHRAGPLPIDTTLRYASCLCGALSYAHGKGVIHRDIKPANVLIGSDDSAKLTDFGIGRIVHQASTGATAGPVWGTPVYMAPEQLAGTSRGSVASDLYSLGVLLYACLAGEAPFTTGDITYQHLHRQPEDVRARRPETPERIAAAVARCLEKDPSARFGSAAELAEALRGHAGTSAEAATTSLRREDSPAPTHRPGLLPLALGVAALLAAVAAIGWLGLSRWRGTPPRTEITEPDGETIGGTTPIAAGIEPRGGGNVDQSPTQVPGPAEEARSQTPIAKVPAGEATPVSQSGERAPNAPIEAEADGVGPDGMVVVAAAGMPRGTAGGAGGAARSFKIDVHEVTVAQFNAFCRKTGRQAPELPAWSKALHPMVNVSWPDAEEYCRWGGKRLPTEAEWEQAASSGDPVNTFPWGGTFICDRGNFDDEKRHSPYFVPGGLGCDGFVETAPVGQFPPNAAGLFDMAGNVWEWCSDPYGEAKGGPGEPPYRVIRGGSWRNPLPRYFRVDTRNFEEPDQAADDVGFRCAADGDTP